MDTQASVSTKVTRKTVELMNYLVKTLPSIDNHHEHESQYDSRIAFLQRLQDHFHQCGKRARSDRNRAFSLFKGEVCEECIIMRTILQLHVIGTPTTSPCTDSSCLVKGCAQTKKVLHELKNIDIVVCKEKSTFTDARMKRLRTTY